MDYQGTAIVIRLIKFGEKGGVLKLYTQHHGLQSFILPSIKSKKGIIRPGMLQPLTILEIVATHKAKGTLERIKEAQIAFPFNEIPFDPVKSSIAFFVQEVLYNSLKEETPNRALFDFVLEEIHALDTTTEKLTLFPQRFLLKLCNHLGFSPEWRTYQPGYFFDLMDGVFLPKAPFHGHALSAQVSSALFSLSGDATAVISKEDRKTLTHELVNYLRIHLESFKPLKSLEVIESLF